MQPITATAAAVSGGGMNACCTTTAANALVVAAVTTTTVVVVVVDNEMPVTVGTSTWNANMALIGGQTVNDETVLNKDTLTYRHKYS